MLAPPTLPEASAVPLPSSASVRRSRGRLLLLLVIVGASVLLATGGFGFPLLRDETHFWRTSLRFSRSLLPPVDLLRDYGELNTPLPFLLNGAMEHLLGGGIAVARAVNFAFSLAILAIVGWTTRSPTLRGSLKPVLGVLLFPYFYLVGLLAYTDVLGTLLVLIGFVLHQHRRYLGSALAFALAIASRQYMLAFPVALALHELTLADRRIGDRPRRWLLPMFGALTILGWVLFFGGLGPPTETHNQIPESTVALLLPRNSLYSLAGLGFYFVIPEALLRWDVSWLARARSRWSWLAAAILAIAFVAFPPIRNLNFPIPTMGYLDLGLHTLLGDLWKQPIFYLLALLPLFRFWKFDLAFWCVAVHVAMMGKAHIAWDKYLFPLIVLLWYLNARDAAESSRAAEQGDQVMHPLTPRS